MNAKKILTLAILGAAALAGTAQACSSSKKTGEAYGYCYRVDDNAAAATNAARQGKFDTFTEGTRQGKFDAFGEGARQGKFDTFTDGMRSVAGMDRSGPSAEPRLKMEMYSDGFVV